MKLKTVLKSIFLSGNRVSFGKEDNWRSYVTTLSPLATAFNEKPLEKSFTVSNETGLFEVKDLRHPNGFYLLKSNAFSDTDRLVHEACNPKRTRKMVAVFDELSDSLCRVADLAEFIRIAHTFKPFATAAEDATTAVNAIVERLNTNQALYNALKQVTIEGDIVPTNEVDKYVAKLFLFDFEQCGIHLDEGKRKRIVSLNDAILHLSNLFSRHCSSARTLPKDALPKSLVSAFPSSGDELMFNHLYSDSSIRLVRQAAYQVYMYPDIEQEIRFRNLILERQDLAHLCGFQTYAHRVLCGSLVENPETVKEFLNNLNEHLKPLAQIEFDAMQKLNIKENPNAEVVQMWDVPYYNNALKKERIDIDPRECARYFSLGVCMEGLNKLLHSLFRVTLKKQNVKMGEVWSEDVYKLAVIHDEEGLLGYIYLDLFERVGKPNQDCHFTIRGGRELSDGTYQLPVVVLMFSLPTPSETVPSLLSPGMVENLFHEMGHAMHSMLARTKYQHVTGTRCSTDFAEVPSILMEYFASDPRVLAEFARDYKTGESIPKDLLNKLCVSRNLLSASELQLQVFYAMVDQWFHGNISELGLDDSGTVSTTDIISQMQQKYYNVPHFPETAWHLRFNHFVGYGAKYYSYLFSKSVASWIWQEHFQKDPFNREAGEAYRTEVLAHGGGRPPKEILNEYLKTDVSTEKLVQFLINEVKSKSFVTTKGLDNCNAF